MKTRVRFIFLTGLVLASLNAAGQDSKVMVSGSWMGTLKAGAVELRIVFNLSQQEDQSYTATMDSPDQGAFGIPMGEVSRSKDSLFIGAPAIMGHYHGRIQNDSMIVGNWSQGGRVFPLTLIKQKKELVLNRPQEPGEATSYLEEDIFFENKEGGFSLGATISIPNGEGPFPALILVSGSGSQNRDEEIFGHKPFKVIADHLARRGIVVLRYDDRGVASSGGDVSGATSADFAVDARSAIDYLLQRPEVDPSKTGVIGHSEGGMIAFMLAAEYADVAFIVSLAGPGVDGKTILLEQSQYIARLSGADDQTLEDNQAIMKEIYELMLEHASYSDWTKDVLLFLNEYFSGREKDDITEEEIEQSKQNLLGSISEGAYPWMRYFVAFDPATVFPSIQCPVLALNGEKDSQVLAKQNIAAIDKGLSSSGNTGVTATVIPGLNHLFQHCETGLPAEYGKIEETFDPVTLELISGWILEQSN